MRVPRGTPPVWPAPPAADGPTSCRKATRCRASPATSWEKSSRWAEIYQINREALGKDYDYLTPGMRLVLPIRDSAPGDRTTRRSEGDVPLLR